MFGSQALETAIGLVLVFYVLSLAASSLVEVYSRLISKRAADLEQTIVSMLSGGDAQAPAVAAARAAFARTSVHDALVVAAGKSFRRKTPKRPSYLSATSFADAVTELLFDDQGLLRDVRTLPPGLQRRLIPLVRETRGDLLSIKAGLERWYDETMERLGGAYKRWATALLFCVGLALAVVTNASTFDVAHTLWLDPAAREIVATSASGVAAGPEGATAIGSVADTVHTLEDLRLPVGWDERARSQWAGSWSTPWRWGQSQLATALGWLATGLLVMLGAPFWFDLLTRLVSLRSSGAKPAPAVRDAASSTSLRSAAGLAGAAPPGTDLAAALPHADPGRTPIDEINGLLAYAFAVPPPARPAPPPAAG